MSTLTAMQVSAAAVFDAFKAGAAAEVTEVQAFAKVVKALPLGDAAKIKEFRDALFAAFGEVHKDAAQYRLNIVNNAAKVAHGGTSKGNRKIKGKGMPAVLQILDGAASMRELKPAMAEAVPEALKPDSGGARTGSGRKGKANGKSKGSAVSVPKVATREEAFAAARKVLEIVGKFLKPSDRKISAAVKALDEVLQ